LIELKIVTAYTKHHKPHSQPNSETGGGNTLDIMSHTASQILKLVEGIH